MFEKELQELDLMSMQQDDLYKNVFGVVYDLFCKMNKIGLYFHQDFDRFGNCLFVVGDFLVHHRENTRVVNLSVYKKTLCRNSFFDKSLVIDRGEEIFHHCTTDSRDSSKMAFVDFEKLSLFLDQLYYELEKKIKERKILLVSKDPSVVVEKAKEIQEIMQSL